MISSNATVRSSRIKVLLVLAAIVSCCFAALPYTGVNLSGGEWDSGPFWPTTQEIDFFASRGMNVIRLPFTWENIQPSASGNFDTTSWGRYTALTDYITKTKGLNVIIEPHNFGRYKGKIVGKDEPLSTLLNLWTRLANYYKTNDKVMFNLMNEPSEMSTSLWANNANSTVKAIRDTTATNIIMVPGNGWTGAWSWTETWPDSLGQISNADAMLIVTDPLNKMFFEFHQYFDSEYGGTDPVCRAPHIGSSTVSVATTWLKQHNKKGFLGELGGSDTTNCITAINDALTHLQSNSDVWMGFAYWSGGPRTSSSFLDIGPLGYPPIHNNILDNVLAYVVNPPVAMVYPNISAASCKNTAPQVIYDDSLQNGWQNWGWADSITLTDPQASTGTHAISFKSPSGFLGLQLGRSSDFSFVNYNAIQFDVKGASAGVNYEIFLHGSEGRSQSLRGYTPSHTITTSYQTATVPYSVFHLPPSQTFTSITWQSSEDTQDKVYLDNIKLVCIDIKGGVLSGSAATPTAGNSPTSSNTPTDSSSAPSDSSAPQASNNNTPESGSNSPTSLSLTPSARVSEAGSIAVASAVCSVVSMLLVL